MANYPSSTSNCHGHLLRVGLEKEMYKGLEKEVYTGLEKEMYSVHRVAKKWYCDE